MEVRKDFAARLEDSCRTIPQESIAMLLRALMPKTRAPATRAPSGPVDPLVYLDGDGSVEILARQEATPAKKRRSPRPAANKRYRVLRSFADRNHRSGTWRYAMVRACVECETVDDAFAYLKDHFPTHAAKGIDFGWNVAQGYITFEEE